ncbi:MAG TPA: hypothetical protein VFB02_09710 [Bradyrhizobium sp.]|nr:hypothetical protein [Bradyrhizobium sp.]
MAQGRAAVDADRTNFAPETVSPERNKDKLETKCSKSGYPDYLPAHNGLVAGSNTLKLTYLFCADRQSEVTFSIEPSNRYAFACDSLSNSSISCF